ncbi:MAG: membrane protein insertase YidC [Actinomyces sp. oral taxon 181]|nr:membrane protein insertase YidC [Actinomyces sp. oral taxon 181]
MDSILYPFVVAVAWLWIRIHDLLLLVGMSSGAGLAWIISIILLTVLVRVLIIPLYLKQLKSMRGTSIVQPQMQKIQAKYKGKTDVASRQRMQQEISELNKKYGVNPFASCLPMLVQLPVLFAMYRAIYAIHALAENTYSVGSRHIDSLGPITQSVASEIDASQVFGVPLSHTIRDSQLMSLPTLVFVIFIIVMVATQFLTIRLTMTKNMPQNQDPNNPMVRSQRMMMYFMPFMFIFSGLFFQMGVVIYTTTAGIWGYLQMLWVIKNIPNPNSAAYKELLAKRQDAYQSWARPFFADYDEKRRDLADGSDELKALNETTLTEVRSRAKRQKIASDFPQAMSAGEIVSVYRNLSMQEWTTLPDEVWMKGVKVATERAAERREAAAKREEAQRQVRARGGQTASSEASSDAEAAELERKRQERRKARRAAAKKKKR